MTLYFLVIISVWSISTSGGVIEHVDSKKIGVFQAREQCVAAQDALAPGLENGLEAHCIAYSVKKDGTPL
jgi:hypothetical protein